MGQVTIYLDQETEKRMRTAAKDAGLSLSRWVSRLIRQKTSDEWPPGVQAMSGAWPDFPEAEQIRQAGPRDLPREQL